MLELQDRRDSAQRDEAHRLTVGNNQDQWPGWLPGVRYPLNMPKVPLGCVDAIANSMF